MKARFPSTRRVTGAPSDWLAPVPPRGVPASGMRNHPPRRARGYLILALLAASITPVSKRQVDQAARTKERADFLAIRESFQHTSRRARAVIGQERYAIKAPAGATPGAVHEAAETFAAAFNPWPASGTWPKSSSQPVFREASAAPSAMSQVALGIMNRPAKGWCV